MSSMRIVLVDPLGDVLFSGESWLASGPAVAAANTTQSGTDEASGDAAPEGDAPATLRSGGSGIFPVERTKPTNVAAPNEAESDTKHGERAA